MIKYICENCSNEILVDDGFCTQCGLEFVALDSEIVFELPEEFLSTLEDGAFTLSSPYAVGANIGVKINGREYIYKLAKIKSGKFKGKKPSIKEAVEYLKSFLTKSKSPGRVLAFIKANFPLIKGSKKEDKKVT